MLISRYENIKKFHFPIQTSLSFSPINLLLINMHYLLLILFSLFISDSLLSPLFPSPYGQKNLLPKLALQQNRTLNSYTNESTHTDSSQFPTFLKHHLKLDFSSTSHLHTSLFKLIPSSQKHTHSLSLSLLVFSSRYRYFSVGYPSCFVHLLEVNLMFSYFLCVCV